MSALLVRCPSCGAPIGYRCRWISIGDRGHTPQNACHVARQGTYHAWKASFADKKEDKLRVKVEVSSL